MNHAESWYNDYGEYTVEEYVTERILNNPEAMERVAQTISHIPEEAETVLDVGCGHGVFLHLLEKERNLKGMGIEISEKKLRYAEEYLHVRVKKGDAAHLPFENRSFDVVTALEVIEHLPYRTYERALKEITRVAKGTIIVSVPYNEKRSFVTCPYCGTKFNPWYHLRNFREGTLRGLFPGFSLQRVDKIGIDYVSPVLLQKLYNIGNVQKVWHGVNSTELMEMVK